jgi:hypothetical protein
MPVDENFERVKMIASNSIDTLTTAWTSAILFTKSIRQIRRNVRFKKYCTNFDARRRIRHIRANEALAPSSLVPQIMGSCAKNVFSHSFRE